MADPDDLKDGVVDQPDVTDEIAQDIEAEPIIPEGLTDRERLIPNVGFSIKF